MTDMIAAIKQHPEMDGTDFLDNVYANWQLMSKGAHPTGEGITQTTGEGEGRFVFGATYNRDLCPLGFDHGLFAVPLLVQALGWVRPQVEDWTAQIDTLQEW